MVCLGLSIVSTCVTASNRRAARMCCALAGATAGSYRWRIQLPTLDRLPKLQTEVAFWLRVPGVRCVTTKNTQAPATASTW